MAELQFLTHFAFYGTSTATRCSGGGFRGQGTQNVRHSKIPGGGVAKWSFCLPDFGCPQPQSELIAQVDNKTGASPNRNYVLFDGYHTFYGDTHSFVP